MDGIRIPGKCSVPMWMGGVPAGQCGEPAWGNYIDGPTFRDGWTGEVRRLDGKWRGYAPGLCCPRHSGPPEPKAELDHFIECGTCGQHFDMRDLGQVVAHAKPDHKPEVH